jgi:hypothetical protein
MTPSITFSGENFTDFARTVPIYGQGCSVSPRPSPIEMVSRHVVAAHQSGYQDALADVSAHLPNRHTGQAHSTLLTG